MEIRTNEWCFHAPVLATTRGGALRTSDGHATFNGISKTNWFWASTRIVTMLRILGCALILGFVNTANAQSFSVNWALTSNANVTTQSGTVNGSALVKGSGVGTLAYNANGVRSNGWNTVTRDLNDYYEFTLAPTYSSDLTVTGISYSRYVDNAAGMTDAVYYSFDNFATSTQVGSDASVTNSHASRDLTPSFVVSASQTLKIRVYGWGANASSRQFYVRNFTVSGTFCSPVFEVYWSLNSVSNGGNTVNVSSQHGPVTGIALTGGTGIGSFNHDGNGVRSSGWTSANLDVTDYYELGFTVSSGASVTVTDLSFIRRHNNSGGMTLAVHYSLDNFATSTQIGSNIAVNTSYVTSDLTTSVLVNAGQTFRVRWYGWGSSSGNFHLKDVLISGSANVASVAITADPAGAICSGTNVTFTAAPVNGGASPVYQWTKNGNPVGSNSPTYSDSGLANGDAVRVTMTSGNSCAAPASPQSNIINMAVTTTVTPSVSIAATGGLQICPGSDVTFTATPVNPGASPVYQWKKNGSNVGSNSPSYVATAPADGDQFEVVMTSNAQCRTTDQANSSVATIEHRSPSGSITSGTATICSTQVPHSINIYVVGQGLLTGTLNPGAIPFSGYAPQITVSVSPSSTTTYTIASLSTTTCSASPSSLTGSAAVTVLQSVVYYLDNDQDGYGDNATAQSSCYGPPGPGYVTIGGDCDDDNPDVNPGADEWLNGVDDNCDGNIDEGLIPMTFYRDQDGDGYGDANVFVDGWLLAPVGYVSNSSDCDDTNPNVHPGATEVCDNAIDDNCNGFVDEGCGPINDYIGTALFLPISPVGACNWINGTLVGAHVSAEEGAEVITGEDVWYYLVPNSPAVSIECLTSNIDVLLELRTAGGSVIDVENVVSGLGTERMNVSGLTVGQTYYLRVRNYNSSQGTGTFQLCNRSLRRSSCNQPSGPQSLCNTFKATHTAANQYNFTFTPTAGDPIYVSVSGGTTFFVMGSVPGFQYNTTYSVTIDAVYNLIDGAGTPEQIIVSSAGPCSMVTGNHVDTYLRDVDSAPNFRFRNSQIAAEKWVCGASAFDFEFTQLTPSPGLPYVVCNNAPNRFINLMTVPVIAPGATYAVRTRPVMGTTPGSWTATPRTLIIAGPLNMNLTEESADDKGILGALSKPQISPNPVSSSQFVIQNLTMGEGSEWKIEVYDSRGALVWNGVALSDQVRPDISLNSGVYLVRATDGHESHMMRLVVSR